MSYARMGELGSDVYVIRHSGGYLVCYCDLDPNQFQTEQEMINHLLLHRELGHSVPQRAFDRLEAERDNRPYKTDVEKALEQFHAETEGVMTRYEPDEETGEQD